MNTSEIESRWQAYWQTNQTYRVSPSSSRPKFYVLDMFPYPSGAGLHVGHPLGYIATDIFSRYKRMKGFEVLHPMGFDSFGLPAEQYAIQTGQHPAVTTESNIARYKEQLNKIGLGYDWDREIRTSDPQYYRWTQWIFLQLFQSWYNEETGKADAISTLIEKFEKEGYSHHEENLTGNIEEELCSFSAAQWNTMSDATKEKVLQHFRLAYLSDTMVNWCPALGTVLANDEVKDGFSERGGHPVERKKMKQWSLRITAYADRLLEGLDHLEWSEALKEAQRNWIGKSEGASVKFPLEQRQELAIEVFTTRPDTLFGVSFLTLAPEHEWVEMLTTAEQKDEVMAYKTMASNRSERDRQADVNRITGVFTGAYAIHPLTGGKVPIWVGDYVLVGYGTGAVMAVPAGDERDWRFAHHFNLPIPPIFEGHDPQQGAEVSKKVKLINSQFINGLCGSDAMKKVIEVLEEGQHGKGRTNYRLRDAAFGRQRYWGEPIPIYFDNGIPKPLPESELPLVLPEVDKFLPTAEGEPPLARAANWTYQGHPLETTTMPGWAGSSWYFIRYMDAKNSSALANPEDIHYWQQVDLYLGGSEHATGHLLYVRFWTMFLYDLGILPFSEPAKKLINQGMIQGKSALAYQLKGGNTLYSADLVQDENWRSSNGYSLDDFIHDIHLPVDCVKGEQLDIEKFRQSNFRDLQEKELHLNDKGEFRIHFAVEKMSKSKLNVVNPDDIIAQYGADTLRLYEMFLGPIELSKPWDTNGIEGVFRFLRKVWNLFYVDGAIALTDDEPTKEEWKVLHKTIKKIGEDIERFSFNTSVSQFMIAVNELGSLKCRKKAILQDLLRCLAPFAPHITAELWKESGFGDNIILESWPEFKEEYLVEDSFEYPVSENGKLRLKVTLSLQLGVKEIEAAIMEHEGVQRFLQGRTPKKVIIVPGKIVNVVV